MHATDTLFNGASIEAAAAIESVKPPMAYWHVCTSRVGSPRCYKIVASGRVDGVIGDPVATVHFDEHGDRIPRDRLALLEATDATRTYSGWMAVQCVDAIRDLLQALAAR